MSALFLKWGLNKKHVCLGPLLNMNKHGAQKSIESMLFGSEIKSTEIHDTFSFLAVSCAPSLLPSLKGRSEKASRKKAEPCDPGLKARWSHGLVIVPNWRPIELPNVSMNTAFKRLWFMGRLFLRKTFQRQNKKTHKAFIKVVSLAP